MLRRRLLQLPLAGLAPWAGDVRAGQGVSRRALVFPADFGAHPDTRTEWWYLTGVLGPDRSDAPAAFGFQLTFFRSRTGVAADHPSRFAARQLVFAHAALSDLQQRRLRHDQRVAREGFGLAEAAEGDTRVQLGGWRLERSGSPEASRYQAGWASDSAGFALVLEARSTQPLLLQGDAGYSRKGPDPGQSSHYYTQPQLAVSGSLTLDGQSRPVHGRAWLDHEWSNTLMHPDAVGWDWIGMNLDGGAALTAFRLRRADGSAVYAGGSWRAPGSPARAFGPDEVVFVPRRHWSSPHSGARYPVAWSVRTPVGSFEVEALFDDQELDSRRSTGAIYWEGCSRLSERGGPRAGLGYLEMTGYAQPLRL